MGVSGYSNGVYSPGVRDHFELWGLDLSYHRGNWYFLTEWADNYQQAKSTIGNNIDRRGLYAQLSYRDYNTRSPFLSKLEYVARYSLANFTGNRLEQARPHGVRSWGSPGQHQPVHAGHQLLVLRQQRPPLRLRDQPGTWSSKEIRISSWHSGPGSGDRRSSEVSGSRTLRAFPGSSRVVTNTCGSQWVQGSVCGDRVREPENSNSKDGGDGDGKPS